MSDAPIEVSGRTGQEGRTCQESSQERRTDWVSRTCQESRTCQQGRTAQECRTGQEGRTAREGCHRSIQHGGTVSTRCLRRERGDVPVALAVAIVCYPVFRSGGIVSRREGIAFVLMYVVYLATLVLLRT